MQLVSAEPPTATPSSTTSQTPGAPNTGYIMGGGTPSGRTSIVDKLTFATESVARMQIYQIYQLLYKMRDLLEVNLLLMLLVVVHHLNLALKKLHIHLIHLRHFLLVQICLPQDIGWDL